MDLLEFGGAHEIQRGADLSRSCGYHMLSLGALRRNHGVHSRLEDSGFFSGDLLQAASEKRFVIEIDRGDHREGRTKDVCRVQATSQTYFDHAQLDACISEEEKCHCGDGLEVRRMRLHSQADLVDTARDLKARVEKHRRRNPYYLYALSAEAFAEGRLGDSVGLLEQAIALNGREYRFHYELARTLVQAGDRVAAQAALERALALAPANALSPDLALDALPTLP